MKIDNKVGYFDKQYITPEKAIKTVKKSPKMLSKLNCSSDKQFVRFNLIYLNSICNLSFKGSTDNKQKYLEELNKKYALKFLEISKKYQNAGQEVLGTEVLELINKFQKEEIAYAEKHSINYIENQQTSLEDLKTAAVALEDMLKLHKELKEGFGNISDDSIDKISFCGETKKLTKVQQAGCHANIHLASLICAGITAASGEFSAFGSDIPGLICTEFCMFRNLTDLLNVDKKAAFLHGANHMFSAGAVGANIVKTATSWLTIIGHPIVIVTTAGTGTLPLTAGLRIGNGALSAAMCEAMGWAFVKDYKNGKMNVKQKGQELAATLTFAWLCSEFKTDFDLEKPAEMLKDKAAEALGSSVFQNMPYGVGSFIEAATKFVQSNTISYAAKGIELITPAIASTVIENGGKLDSKSVEQIIKGSVFSLICGDLLGNATNLDETNITEKAKKILGVISQDPQIKEMIDDELLRRGIKQAGEIVFDKNTVKCLETFYNELTPKLTEIVKTIRGL